MTESTRCEACGLEIVKTYTHHVKPRVKGGSKGRTVECCYICANQVHMLFSVDELSKMTWEELLKTDEIAKYIRWRKKHTNDYYQIKMSKKVKRKRKH